MLGLAAPATPLLVAIMAHLPPLGRKRKRSSLAAPADPYAIACRAHTQDMQYVAAVSTRMSTKLVQATSSTPGGGNISWLPVCPAVAVYHGCVQLCSVCVSCICVTRLPLLVCYAALVVLLEAFSSSLPAALLANGAAH